MSRVFTMPIDKLEFAKMLVCSTAHMSLADSCCLSDCPHLSVVEYPEGFYITLDKEDLSDDDFVQDLVEYGLSEDLVSILRAAVRELSCSYIKFDCSGPTYKRYKTHEW